LRAVDERDALLGVEAEGFEVGFLEGLGAGQEAALIFGFAFSDEDQGHVGERGEVSAGSDAASGGDSRGDAFVEQAAEAAGDDRADAGDAHGEHVGADQHHGSDGFAGQGIADSAGVGADDVALELFEVLGGDARVGQQADSGVDRINRGFAGGEAFDHFARGAHAFGGVRVDFDLFVVAGDAGDFFQGQRGTGERDHTFTVS
jgi:hypothetical protein